jgi:hypothetical protein
LSFVKDITAIPLTKPTFCGLWVERLNGDDQLPTAQPAGMPAPSNSSRDGAPNVPLSYEEYCTQLMYSWTGSVVLLMSPPKLEFPGHRLKCIVMPPVAFWANAVAVASVSRRNSFPSTDQEI